MGKFSLKTSLTQALTLFQEDIENKFANMKGIKKHKRVKKYKNTIFEIGELFCT